MKGKRLLAAIAGVVAVSFLLAGCGSDTKTASSGSATKGDIVWWGYTPGSPVNEQYIKAFNKQYPDIHVTWKQTSVDDYDASLRPALAASNGLDAYQMSVGSANGSIDIFGSSAVDLTPAVEKALGPNWKDQLSTDAVNALTQNGKVKALGVGSVYAGNWWINQDIFDKYGLKPPTNYDELKQVCATLKSHNIGCLTQGAAQGAFNIDFFHAIVDNVKEGEFNDAATGKTSWNSTEIKTALQLWRQLFTDGIIDQSALGQMQFPDANNLFMSGKYAMIMMGSWYTQNVEPDIMTASMQAAGDTDKPFTMMPIDFPDIAGTGHSGDLFGDVDYSTAVSTKSKNVAAAETFVVWLGTSKEGQQTIADSLNSIPILKSAKPNWDAIKMVDATTQEQAVQDYISRCESTTGNSRFLNIDADMNQKLIDVLAAVAGGTMSPADGAAQLQAQQEASKK